jgi:phosphatidylserine/phosphatidylglycerophosphate/cardiolipin synthase-like enzyme
VITGSFNWTYSAVKDNQENLVVMENDDLVRSFTGNFEKLWSDFAENKIKSE